jgi:hypothetical protein
MKKIDMYCISFSLTLLLCAIIVHGIAILTWSDLLPRKDLSNLAVIGIGFAIGLSFLFTIAAIGTATKKFRSWFSRTYRSI